MSGQNKPAHRPVVILTASRSGSSLVSGIFHEHGCWVGNCHPGNQYNPKGYFENLDIKRRFKKFLKNKQDWLKDKKRAQEDFKHLILDVLRSDSTYEDGMPWLVKHDAITYWLWEWFDPYFVSVRRDWASSQKSRMNIQNEISDDLQHQYNKAFADVDAAEIWPSKFKYGDFSELQTAIEGYGLEYNQKIVDSFYDAGLWHY